MYRCSLFFLALFFSFGLLSQNGQVKAVTEKEVAERLEELNKLTPINLVYNKDVQAYIDVYTVKRSSHLAKIIGLSQLYFPIFEEYLSKAGLPLELKYLAIVESALDPKAVSPSGATGLWQILFHASRMFDLQINSYIDERCDPVKSTEAATRYLKYLYDNFHNWDLALAAYNGGIAKVNEAISKSNGKSDFWEIKKHLSAETRGYVPAFIAVNYVMNYYESYGITPIIPDYKFDDIEAVTLEKSATFKQISTLLDISVEDIRFLNPVYIMDFVPASVIPVQFSIPKSKTKLFLEKKEQLLMEKSPETAVLQPIGNTAGRKKTVHTVAKGEFFHKIAMDYECRVEDIQEWNNLKSRDLMAGQQLLIWKPVERQPYFFICQEFNYFLE
jgi:membrane-bound lytic murein transglycosylase D